MKNKGVAGARKFRSYSPVRAAGGEAEKTKVGVERGYGPRHAANALEGEVVDARLPKFQGGSEAVPSKLPSPPVEDLRMKRNSMSNLRPAALMKALGGELGGLSKEDVAKIAISLLVGGEGPEPIPGGGVPKMAQPGLKFHDTGSRYEGSPPTQKELELASLNDPGLSPAEKLANEKQYWIGTEKATGQKPPISQEAVEKYWKATALKEPGEMSSEVWAKLTSEEQAAQQAKWDAEVEKALRERGNEEKANIPYTPGDPRFGKAQWSRGNLGGPPEEFKRGKAKVGVAKGFGPRHAENAKEGDLTQVNTDTVPAMLTPREAVLNRNAAELAGRGAIEKLNEEGNALAKKGVDLAAEGDEDVPANAWGGEPLWARVKREFGDPAQMTEKATKDLMHFLSQFGAPTEPRRDGLGPRISDEEMMRRYPGLKLQEGEDDVLKFLREPDLAEEANSDRAEEKQQYLDDLEEAMYRRGVPPLRSLMEGNEANPRDVPVYRVPGEGRHFHPEKSRGENLMLQAQEGTKDMKSRQKLQGGGQVAGGIPSGYGGRPEADPRYGPRPMPRQSGGMPVPQGHPGVITAPRPIPYGAIPHGPNDVGMPGPMPPIYGTVPQQTDPMLASGSFYPKGMSRFADGTPEVLGIGAPNPTTAYGKEQVDYKAPNLDGFWQAIRNEAKKQGLTESQMAGIAKQFSGLGGGGSPSGGDLPYDQLGGQYASFTGGTPGGYQGGISDIGYPPFIAPGAVYHADKGSNWIGDYDPAYMVNRYARGTGDVPPSFTAPGSSPGIPGLRRGSRDFVGGGPSGEIGGGQDYTGRLWNPNAFPPDLPAANMDDPASHTGYINRSSWGGGQPGFPWSPTAIPTTYNPQGYPYGVPVQGPDQNLQGVGRTHNLRKNQ